jgi:hypothetical protein
VLWGVICQWNLIFSIPFGFFPEKTGTFSKEHGERCHQNTSQIKKRYSEKWIPNMLPDYC